MSLSQNRCAFFWHASGRHGAAISNLVEQMARREPTWLVFAQARCLHPTAPKAFRAARSETAAGRYVDRAGRLALEEIIVGIERLLLQRWSGRQQRLGIGMLRVEEKVVIIGNLHHLSQIHH